MNQPNEFEDLQALLQSPGWLRFARHAETEWGEKLQDKLTRAVGDTDDAQALAKLRQVMVAKTAIETLLRWPKERLSQLEQASNTREREQTVTLSRRGSL